MSFLKHPKSLKPWPQIIYEEFIANEEKIATKAKLDSLGRKRHPNQNIGKKKIYQTISVRIDIETVNQIKAKGKLANKIRDYIEWGIENDK